MNGTGADDHLSSSNVLARGCAHAHSTPTIEQHTVDEHVASHVEVRPRPSRLEVGVVRRDAPAVAHGQRAAATPVASSA